MYFILTYTTVENYIELRAPFRSAHLALVQKYHDNGILILAGALANPPDKAVLIFKCNSKTEVENFVSNDPYVQNGIIKSWEVREWTVVIGNLE